MHRAMSRAFKSQHEVWQCECGDRDDLCLASAFCKRWFPFERRPQPSVRPCVYCSQMPEKFSENTVTSSRRKEKRLTLLLLSQWLALSDCNILVFDLFFINKSSDFPWSPHNTMLVMLSFTSNGQSYLLSSVQVLVKKTQTSNVKANFGVWLLDSLKNLEGSREILFVSRRHSLVPLAQSVQEGHVR